MATGNEILAMSLNNIVNTKNSRYNQILSYLVQQETISPGNISAIQNAIRTEMTAIQRERTDISNAMREKEVQEGDLLIKLKEIQSRQEIANLEARTKMEEARTKIETATLEGKQAQQDEARSQFNRATGASGYNDDLGSYISKTPVSQADAQKLVKDQMVQFYQSELAAGRRATSGKPIATAGYDDLVAQELLDAGETNKQLGGAFATVDYQQAADEAKAELGIGQVTAEQAIEQYQREGDALAAKVGTRGVVTEEDSARLITLGIENPEALVVTRTFNPQNYEFKVGSAAFNSRVLERDEALLEEYATFGTFADFEEAMLNVDDPDHATAVSLYNKTLLKSASEINALAGGEYPARLLAVRDREDALAARQKRLDEMIEKQRTGQTRSIEELTMEANRIYNNLYGIRKGKASRQDIQALDTLFQGKSPEERKAILDELPYSDRQKKRIGNVMSRGAMKNIKELKQVIAADEPLVLDLQDDNWASTDIVTTITNEAGQDVLVGKVTQVPVTDWTLSDLYQEVKGTLDPAKQQVFEDVIEVYNNAAMDGKLPPRLSRELGVVADAMAEEVGALPATLPKQTSVTPTPPPIPTIPEVLPAPSRTNRIASFNASGPSLGAMELEMLDAVRAEKQEEETTMGFGKGDIGNKQPGGAAAGTALGKTGEVVSDAIAATFKNAEGTPMTLTEYKKATDEATELTLEETIGKEATAIIMNNKDTLEKYGELVAATGGSLKAEDLFEIVPEGRINNNVRMGLNLVARNGMQLIS